MSQLTRELDLPPPRRGQPTNPADRTVHAENAFPQDEDARVSALSMCNLPVQRDLKFDSMKVMLLRESNFDGFIGDKEKVLVYFYDTNKPQNPTLEAQFSDAADKTPNRKYGFASVDCLFDNKLCGQQNVSETPALKLFSNGFEMSRINSLGNFTSDQMRMLMKMTPILSQPRVELGKDYLAQAAVERPRKRRGLLCV